jgi:hypothetical protein
MFALTELFGITVLVPTSDVESPNMKMAGGVVVFVVGRGVGRMVNDGINVLGANEVREYKAIMQNVSMST